MVMIDKIATICRAITVDQSSNHEAIHTSVKQIATMIAEKTPDGLRCAVRKPD